MASTEFLLRKVDEAVDRVRQHYEADLAAKRVSDELLYAVLHVISDCLSALDWTASAVWEKYGSGKGRSPYFPLRSTAAEFERGLDEQIKGLRANHPHIAQAMERHQPYQPGKAALGYLHKLGRVNKHQDFTAQTRSEERRIEARGAGGGSISWNPTGVTFGSGVSMFGVPVNPSTQRPAPDPSVTVRETVWVDWRFRDPPVSVLPTLEALARLVREAVEDVRGEAKL
jgi:hypothetical protein